VDITEPGKDRRAPADERKDPVAYATGQGRSALVEDLLDGGSRHAWLAGGATRTLAGPGGGRAVMHDENTRRDAFERGDKVHPDQGEGAAPLACVGDILDDKRAVLCQAVTQLASKLREQRRPAVDRSRPGPHLFKCRLP
jgi:hypothetical protein